MLFKSLRERILVFFSLLILGVQLVSFAVVNRSGKDVADAQFLRDAENRQRIFSSLVGAEYRQLDTALRAAMPAAIPQTIPAALSHAMPATVLGQSFSDSTPAVQRIAEALGAATGNAATRVLTAQGEGEQVTALFAGGVREARTLTAQLREVGSLLAAPPSALAATTNILAAPAATTPRHFFFAFDNRFYLASTLTHSDAGGSGWLSAAVDIGQGLGVAVAQAMGSQLKITGPAVSANVALPRLPETGVMSTAKHWQKLDMQNLPFATPAGLQIELSHDNSTIAAQFERQNKILMLLMAGALLLTLLGGYALADELTRPLKALTKVAKNIKKGRYDFPLDAYQHDEIGQLADTIRHMCRRVAEREERIKKLAYADPLTGLPNRALFDDRLNQAVSSGIRTGAAFSVVLMDLDRFKYINDVLGHESGDFVLCEVALRLESVLRESDTVARLGGDEFALLLAGGNEYQTMSAINKILEVFEEPVNLNNQPLDVACSLGITNFPEHGEDASLLLRRADMAMYAAKRLNSGYSFYDPECDQHQQEHLSLLGDIKRAVENDELQLYYQPKISFNNEALLSVETLLRWQHPRQGLIPPEEFIPFAEQTGAIRLITRWLLKHAIKQCGVWHKEGMHIQMALNISARDLVDPDLPEIVTRELHDNRVPPETLCMEITESALMQDPAKAKRTIEVLHAMGIKMSIDDYGTGYSSLAYVKNLPVNELKIDREFVKNMMRNKEDSAIVKSTIELGHNLGMRVVAEGIEEEQELDMLKSFGCDQGQGFLISHALTALDLEEWMRSKKIHDASAPGVDAGRYGLGSPALKPGKSA